MTLSPTIAQHLHPDVPAVSAATLVNGVADTGTAGCTPDTLFQAASISKPVAALAALILVDNDVLELDTGVNDQLGSWRIPDDPDWANRITLRQLLCHGGGLGPDSYPGYPQGTVLPSLDDVLAGRAPANAPGVRSLGLPGLAPLYSGGGYSVIQRLIEDNQTRSYAEFVNERIFLPLGMVNATFTAPDPAEAALGHARGNPLPGGWRLHPELAAAGLWCTPTDLVLFAAALQNAFTAGPQAILDPILAQAMMVEHLPGWGLGVELAGPANGRWFHHGGSNEGYRAHLSATVGTGPAVAVMTNGEDGGEVIDPLTAALRTGLAWPDPAALVPTGNVEDLPPVDPEQVAALYSGTYVTLDGYELILSGVGRRFTLRAQGQRPIPIIPLSKTRAISPALPISLTFTLDPAGVPTGLTLHQFDVAVIAVKS
ncbi:serine hydrolase domain-containing protein [Hamadaea tsunoensis]|uniref:serine hydrolase domain-containing protein n=1 Tax=Hamadaea tsunoensis TaxID=53368 RepID=UPI000412122D|nr:serine hydrolase domain-containing protein [Hamadaea tsunoensis]